MKTSDSVKAIFPAIIRFCSEIKNPHNTKTNPHFRSKYAPLNEILNEVRPVLAQNDLAVFQDTHGDGEHISIITTVLHLSGEWIQTEPLTLKAEKATPQGAGSAITYGRRYSLSAALSISSEDDDDGNCNEPGAEPKRPAQREPAPAHHGTQESAGGEYKISGVLAGFTEKSGTASNGRAWTLYTAELQDGTKASTFDGAQADAISASIGATVELVCKKTAKGGNNIVSMAIQSTPADAKPQDPNNELPF